MARPELGGDQKLGLLKGKGAEVTCATRKGFHSVHFPQKQLQWPISLIGPKPAAETLLQASSKYQDAEEQLRQLGRCSGWKGARW